MSIESVMPSNHLILCRPLLLLPSIFPSIRVFSSESVLLIKRPKNWSFSFSISPSNEYSGLISFRMDWLDLLAVQGTLKSLLQHHSSKESILWCSAFFRVIDLDKAVVLVIRLTSFLWVWFQCVCPLMPSCNTYCLTWVSLTLGVGYLFTAAPAKRSRCTLPWTRGISSPLPFLTFNVG